MSNLLYDPIKTHSTITDSVIVAFSTGKDSIVTLDLCMKYFKHVEAYFMYFVPNLEFQEHSLKKYEQYYDIKIHRVPHPDLSYFMRYGTYRTADLSIPELQNNDIDNYMRAITGIPWIADGQRINDSITRRAMIKHSGTTDFKRGRFFPVAHWTKKEIYDYIKFKKLYLPKDSREIGCSFGGLRSDELVPIKNIYPDDYQRILKFFPFAKTIVKRYEEYGI